MRTKPVFLSLGIIVAAGACWYAFDLRQHRLAAERETAVAQTRRERIEFEIKRTEARLTAAKEDTERALATLATAVPVKPPVAKSSPPPASNTSGALRDALLHDPQFQNLQLAVTHEKLTATYQPLFDRLKLSPEQSAQALANFRKRGEQAMDLGAIEETQHLAPNDPVLAKLKQQATDEFRTAQIAALGEAGWKEFESYERAVPLREFVNELAGAMTIAGAGLDAAQAEALTAVFAETNAAYRAGETANRNRQDWDQALVAAKGVLTPAQFALFRNGAVQARNMDKMRELAVQR
jgi:hypothetical protein